MSSCLPIILENGSILNVEKHNTRITAYSYMRGKLWVGVLQRGRNRMVNASFII